MKKLFVLLFLTLNSFYIHSDPLLNAISNDIRSPQNQERDEFRHPYETLTFFGIEPSMKVVELSPGGGWYTEILATYLKKDGQLIAAHFDKDSKNDYLKKIRTNFEKKMDSNSNFNNVKIVDLSSKYSKSGSVDAVLTFRNLHNWIDRSWDDIFIASHKVLKKGGVLGVVEHRAIDGTSVEEMKKTGYVTEDYAIKNIEKFGFKLVSKSEINSNPKDTKDYPKGVWTLPPVLRLKDKDQEKYVQIGESDRFTFLFRKI